MAELQNLKGILSPMVIVSLLLLGLFPLIAKFMVKKMQQYKVYKGG